MGELQARLEAVQASIASISNTIGPLCTAMPDPLSLDNLQPGYDVIYAVAALLNNPYLSQETICRYAMELVTTITE